jgi:hypothetical protein
MNKRVCLLVGSSAIAALAILSFRPYAIAQNGQPLTRFDSMHDWESFPKIFKPFNIAKDRQVTVCPDGVKFEFGSEKKAGASGMRAEVTLNGNFQIEVNYDIESWPDQVAEGYGVTIGMWIEGDRLVGGAGLNRFVDRKINQYRFVRTIPVEKKTQYDRSAILTKAVQGRIAIRRIGTNLIALTADTPDVEFVQWKQITFTDTPVRAIILSADTGGAEAELKGRLYNLQITSGADVPINPEKEGPVARTINPLPKKNTLTNPLDTKNTLPPVYPNPLPPALDPNTAQIDPESNASHPSPIRAEWCLPIIALIIGFGVWNMIRRRRRAQPNSSSAKQTADRTDIEKLEQ